MAQKEQQRTSKKESRFRPLFPNRTSTLLERQRLVCLVVYTVLVSLGLTVNLLGLSGPQTILAFIMNSSMLALTLILMVAYLFNKLSLARSLGFMTIVAQLFTSHEMIQCAFKPTTYGLMLIMGNLVLLTGNCLFSIAAHFRYNTHLLCFISTLTYIACCIITGDHALANFAALIVMMFLFISILGDRLVRSINQINSENENLKREEEAILKVLRLQKEDVKSYINLVHSKGGGKEGLDSLLDVLEPESRRNLVQNVQEYLNLQEARRVDMAKTFPELTPSELEICHLIIQGKKLRDICAILGKNEGNINCQRANVRKKLGLTQGMELRGALLERIARERDGQ